MCRICYKIISVLFVRFPEECGDWRTLPVCQHVDGTEFVHCSGFHHARLRKFPGRLAVLLQAGSEM